MCRTVGNLAVLTVRAIRINNSWIGASVWETSRLFTYPSSIAPAISEVNAPAVSNASKGSWALGLSIDSSGINVRVLDNTDVSAGVWVSGTLAWEIAR